VLAGDSVAQALADPACSQIAGAADSQDAARGYPEPAAASTSLVVPSGGAGGARAVADRAVGACPQPWCAFSLVRFRLSELGEAPPPGR
jgi:hypothetical protein